MKKNIAIIGLLACGLVLVGCGERPAAPRATVTGTVTWNDEPLADADVQFVLKGSGDAASARTDSSGAYEILAPIGLNEITCVKTEEHAADTGDDEYAGGQDDTGDASPDDPAMAVGEEEGPGAATEGRPVTPAKYMTRQESGLRYEVKAGDGNKYDIKMVGEGQSE